MNPVLGTLLTGDVVNREDMHSRYSYKKVLNSTKAEWVESCFCLSSFSDRALGIALEYWLLF